MTETETQHICLYGGRYVKLKALNWCDAEINSKLKLLISKEEPSSWPTGKTQRHATMTCHTTEHRRETGGTQAQVNHMIINQTQRF